MLVSRLFWLVTACLALGACADDPRDDPLKLYDFTDMQVVADVASRLAVEERGIFKTYAIEHLASSDRFCGEKLVSLDGREPLTIGDAIDFTIERQKRDAELLAAQDLNNYSPQARRFIAIEELESRRDELVGERETFRMLSSDPDGIEETAEWKRFERRIAEVDAELAQLASR